MKQIRVKLNMSNGTTKTLDSVTLYEGEQYATKIVAILESGASITGDQWYLEVQPKGKDTTPQVYNATCYNNKVEVLLPRIATERGQFKYTFVRYNEAFTELQKWYPTPLFVSVAGDITIDTLESRPDVFADINKRLKKLEDFIFTPDPE